MPDQTVYIILFADHTLTTSLQMPREHTYQAGARFFAVDEKFSLGDLSECFYFQWDIDKMSERLRGALNPF